MFGPNLNYKQTPEENNNQKKSPTRKGGASSKSHHYYRFAEEESMDDSFGLRVEKVFGSLGSWRSSSLQSSRWSITDDEVERKQWRRCPDTSRRDETPCSASFDEFMKKDRRISRRRKLGKEVEDDELEGGDEGDDEDGDEGLDDGPYRRGQDGQDEWSIRSSIGLDCTLDYEEEEDEFDKVACGRENAGDRLYMRGVTEHGSYLNSHNVLANSLHDTVKDPRANHLAAKFRLKEDKDEAEAQQINSVMACAAEVLEPHVKASKGVTPPKSVLKRRNDEASSKVQKRVKFDVGCKTDCGEASEKNATVPDYVSLSSQKASGLPDYLVNPHRYTRYTFDSTSEVEDDNNVQACINFTSQVKSFSHKSGSEVENGLTNLPKSITFISKKKSSDAKVANDSNKGKQDNVGDSNRSVLPVSIAAGEVEGEVITMVGNELETNAADRVAGFLKPVRRYRTISRSESDDSDS